MASRTGAPNATVPPQAKTSTLSHPTQTQTQIGVPLSQLTVNQGLAAKDPKAAIATQATAARPKAPTKTYNEMMIDQERSVDSFLKDLTYMVAALASKCPKDPDIQELRDKYMAVKNDISAQIVISAGKLIYQYRQLIEAADANAEKFFLTTDFANDYAKVRGEMVEADNFERFPEIMTKIRLTWRCFSTEEKNQFWMRAKNMLKQYATYQLARKGIEQLREK